jgi:beta-galactosidase
MQIVTSTPQSRTNRDTLWLAGAVRQLRFGFCQLERLVSCPLKGSGMPTAIAVLLLLFAALCSSGARAQQVEPSLPHSQRLTINLAGGLPEYKGDPSSS